MKNVTRLSSSTDNWGHSHWQAPSRSLYGWSRISLKLCGSIFVLGLELEEFIWDYQVYAGTARGMRTKKVRLMRHGLVVKKRWRLGEKARGFGFYLLFLGSFFPSCCFTVISLHECFFFSCQPWSVEVYVFFSRLPAHDAFYWRWDRDRRTDGLRFCLPGWLDAEEMDKDKQGTFFFIFWVLWYRSLLIHRSWVFWPGLGWFGTDVPGQWDWTWDQWLLGLPLPLVSFYEVRLFG
ncbi:hypothetical protein QBC37DRAFT_424067 [Rhypophila decipiens]|uniref:Uncharacterized protein n=1 Tax=Rhypophila decipiens TaxID=261697 RepID=A0AAN6Y5M5_9PEZI|nr:hypothetical protein QBC37DRAFT_424067 [Rhypophila decipiens]